MGWSELPGEYSRSPQYLLFTTAFRCLEDLTDWPKVLSLLGVLEKSVLGVELGARTKYGNIRRMGPSAILSSGPTHARVEQYTRLCTTPTAPGTIKHHARIVRDELCEAVVRRAGSDTGTIAFLSGGLDSRAVVTVLRDRGIALYTFNFSEPDSEDSVFANLFAQNAGSHHFSRQNRTPRPRWTSLLSEAWRALPANLRLSVERPGYAWTGDGGSIGVGCVRVTESAVKALRAGLPRKALDLALQDWGAHLPMRLFPRVRGEEIRAAFTDDCLAGLTSFDCEDPGRALYHFLLANDQARHLDTHFEDLDVHGLELHTPFFDADLLRAVAAVPLDYCLNHRLYHEVVQVLPPMMRSGPWQTYPGHEPCPVLRPPDLSSHELSYQWTSRAALSENRGDPAVIFQTLRPGFQASILLRFSIIGASVAQAIRIRNTGHILQPAEKILRGLAISEGRWEL